MDVRCERCRAQYAFEDSQITAAGLTVHCSACGHVFRVKKKELVVTIPVRPGEEDVPPPAAPPPAAPPAPPQWTIRLASGQVFSFTELNTLQRWIVERRVTRDDEVSQGDGTWVQLGTLGELQAFFDVVEAANRAEERTTSRYPAANPSAPPPAAWTPPPAPAFPLTTPPRGQTAVELDEAELRAVGHSSRSRTALVVLLLLVVAGAALAYVVMPSLFGNILQPRPKPVAAVTPPPAAPAPPIELPPAPPPAPAPEVKPPEPEPEPAAEPPAAKAPEPAPETRKPARAHTLKQQLAEARRLREANRWEQALDLFGRVTSQDPENVEALTGRGLCYLDLEQYAPAEASLQEALRLSPTQADALLGLGETYRAQGRKAEAIAQFERYLAAHPGGEEAAVARNAINQLKE